MPHIIPYESQVSPSVSPDRRRASAANGDGGIGQLAQGLARANSNAYDRHYEQDEADTLATTAKLKDELATRRQQAAISGEAADPDWLDNERQYAQDQLSTATGNLRTADGKRQAQWRAARVLADETMRGSETQATVVGQLQKNQLQDVEDLTLRGIQKDPSGHRSATDGFVADLMDSPAYSRLSKDLKQDYARQFQFKAAKAFVDGTDQTYGSAAALSALDQVRDDIPADQYTALRDHFTNRAKQEGAQDKEVQQYALFQKLQNTITAGGDPRGMISKGVDDKLLSAEQAMGWHDHYDKYVEKQRKLTDADTAFRAGDLATFTEVDPSLRKEVADRWVTEQVQSYGDATPAEKQSVAQQIVQKGVQMDYVFNGLKSQLRASPHGAGFDQAVDLYRSLEAYDPYYASKYVSEDQRARFDVYTQAVLGGATKEQGLSFAQNITPKTIAETKQLIASEDGKNVRATLKSKMSDRPGWFTGDMLNGQQAATAVMDRATVMLAGNPAASLDSVVASAQTAYESQNARMGNLWVPRQFLSGVPGNKMTTVAERITTRLPAVLQANNLPVIDGKYALAPDGTSDRDGRLQVYDPIGFPVPGLRFGPEDFKGEYRAMQGEEYAKARKDAKQFAPATTAAEEYKRRTGFAPPADWSGTIPGWSPPGAAP